MSGSPHILASASLALALGLALAAPPPVRACSCMTSTTDQARRAATLVFEGVLLRHDDDGHGGGRAVFRVARVWKGDVGRRQTVATPGIQSMCPPHFEVGGRYVVYVQGTDAAPRVTQCARYGAGEGLAAERRALGRPIRTYR